MTSSDGSNTCDMLCARNSTDDGYTSCAASIGHPITVWRQFTSAPDISFEDGTDGFISTNTSTAKVSVAVSSAQALSGSHSLQLTVTASGAGNVYLTLTNPGNIVKPGKNMTMYLMIPSGTNWDHVQPYAQDGPAKNYRWNNGGFFNNGDVNTEWGGAVVSIPADFAITGSVIGAQIHLTGAGTIKVYLDSIFFDS